MLLPALSRRAFVLALGAATVPPPKPSFAATDGLAQLRAAQQTLARVDGLLPEQGSWLEAQRLLSTLNDGVLTKALEASTDPVSVKDRAMDQAAFIVYYEEVRYNDKRLEPQTPSARADQNGKKKEFLRALADERAELSFLLKQKDEEVADLRRYSADAQRSLAEFLELVTRSRST